MARMNELQNVLNNIKADKDEHIIPNNLRSGVRTLGVDGAFDYDEEIEEINERLDTNEEDIETNRRDIEEIKENIDSIETEYSQGVKEGLDIDITDAAESSKNRLELFGNTEQTTYEGKNLFNTKITPAIRGYLYNNQFVTKSNFADLSTYFRCEPNTTYTISRQILTSSFRVAEYDSEEIPTSTSTQQSYPVINEVDKNNDYSITITTTENAKMLLIHYGNNSTDTPIVAEDSKNSIQIEKGSTATDFEPYVRRTI